MSQIFISFCIPTYNRASYLNRCIESVLCYRSNDIEIIVQDNCSTDNTEKIVNTFNDKRIRYFKNNSNIGPLLNIRTIIDKTEGKYCFFLSDDDVLIPGAIQVIKNFLLEKKPYAFISDLIVYLEQSKKTNIHSALSITKSNDELSPEEKAKIIIYSHILTGICFEKSKVDFDFYDKNLDMWYPSILIMGMLNKNIGYLAYPIAIHTWENELFWGIDNHNKLLNNEIEGYLRLDDVLNSEMQMLLAKQFTIITLVKDKRLLRKLSFKDRTFVKISIIKKEIMCVLLKIFKNLK